MPNMQVYQLLLLIFELGFYPVLLIAGLTACVKLRFKAGVFFFLLMLLHQVLLYPFAWILDKGLGHLTSMEQFYVKRNWNMRISFVLAFLKLLAVAILLLGLIKRLDGRNLAAEFMQRVRHLAGRYRRTAISLAAAAVLGGGAVLVQAVLPDFKLVEAKASITANPSGPIVSITEEGEEPVLPDLYVVYTFVVKNKKWKRVGEPFSFVELHFIPSRQARERLGPETFQDNRGNSGPGYFESRETREIRVVYGLHAPEDSDLKELEKQALHGRVWLTLNWNRIATFTLR